MHDANEMECLIFENAIKNILLGKVTKSGVSDANNKLIITIFQMWGHIDPIRSGIGLKVHYSSSNIHQYTNITNITEKYCLRPGAEPRVSRLTYVHSTN